MVFTRALPFMIRNGSSVVVSAAASTTTAFRTIRCPKTLQIRYMGGGVNYLKTSPTHIFWGEAMGVVCWLWIFYRARQDLPVVLGWRHPWEHDDDHHNDNHHSEEHTKEDH